MKLPSSRTQGNVGYKTTKTNGGKSGGKKQKKGVGGGVEGD